MTAAEQLDDPSDEPVVEFPCTDCGRDTIGCERVYYMVDDHVWAQAGMRPDGGFLCVGCLEVRLGRPLTGCDFPPHVPLNWPAAPWSDHDSPRLRALKQAAAALPRPYTRAQSEALAARHGG